MIKITVRRDDHEYNNPRAEVGGFGIMACWHRKYTLGDIQPKEDPTDWKDNQPEGSIFLPLFLMDHSGISMSCRDFQDKWDSGQVGWIAAHPERIEGWFDVKEITTEILEKAKEVLREEVEVYNYQLTNECWGYTIEEVKCCSECGSEKNEPIDSCWGFLGKYALEDMKEHVSEEYHEALTEAWNNR